MSYRRGCSNPVQSYATRRNLRPERTVVRTLGDHVAWSDNDIRKLVCLYKRNPCLWKRNDPFYLVSEQKRRAYEEICRNMTMCLNPKANRGVTPIEIIMKLREVRKSYVTELKKIFEARSSRCRYHPTTEWFCDIHDFLYPYLDYDETVDLHQLVDRCIVKDERDYQPNQAANQRMRKNMKRQTTSRGSDGRFSRQAVEDGLVRSSGWKAASWTKKYRDRSKTPCMMRSICRSSDKLVSRSSRNSSTEFGASSSDIDVGSGSPAVIRENQLAHRDSGRKSESYIDTESGSTLKPSTRTSHGPKRSLINQTGGRILRHDESEIFTKCMTRKPRNTQPYAAPRDRTDVGGILNDRVLHSNADAVNTGFPPADLPPHVDQSHISRVTVSSVQTNINSQRSAVNQASTASRSNVPCRISIPLRRHDFTRRIGTFRGRKINASNGRSIGDQTGLPFQDGFSLRSRGFMSYMHQRLPMFMPVPRYCTCGPFPRRGRGFRPFNTCPFY